MKKHLLSQLNKLQDIKPDQQWKTDSQEFLRTHISNGVETGAFSKVVLWVKDFAKVSSQPAFALVAFVLILITGAIFSNPIYSNAQPNDSLYIARIISEKAQVNMTFNKENRDKLSAQFATNHAQDITNLINDPDFHSQEGSEDEIASLSDDFNKEINSARASINSINKRNRDNKTNKNNGSDLDSEDSDVASSEADDEGAIFSADTKIDNLGLEISVKEESSSDNNDGTDTASETKTTEIDTATSTEEDTATSTDEDTAESTNSPEADTNTEEQNASSTLNELQSITNEVNEEGKDVDEAIKALDDAQRLFNEEKFPEASDKLIEVKNMLEGASSDISDEPSVE